MLTPLDTWRGYTIWELTYPIILQPILELYIMEQNSEANNKTLSYLTNSAQQKNLLQFKTVIYFKNFWRQYVSGTTALLCLFVCLFLVQQPPSGPWPPRSQGF